MSKTPFDLGQNDGFYYFLSATLGSEVKKAKGFNYNLRVH